MYDLDDECNQTHIYINDIIRELSDQVITFKPKIENYLGITKDMCNDKYMGLIILINESYLCEDDKLNNLLEIINEAINKLD